jgi:Diadenosine tetraphosphate (Ap4A) hydrolase and other HIT family hydrolases
MLASLTVHHRRPAMSIEDPTFALDPRLAADGRLLAHAPLCELLLMEDARYPWCVLVPRRAGVTELFQLGMADRAQLWHESACLSQALLAEFHGDKLNVAALGNVVPQLHLHHIVRHVGDDAWPGPVWGRHPPRPYASDAQAVVCARLLAALPADWQAHAATHTP